MSSVIIHNDCNKLLMSVDTELTQIKKFNDAYTVLDDWNLEQHYDNSSEPILASNPPSFLNNACGVFEMTMNIKLTNNSAQNICNSNLIFMNSLLSSKKYHTDNSNYYISYGNLNFVILSNDVSITTYILDNVSCISSNSYPISANNYQNLISTGSPHYSNTTNNIVIKAKIYVMNCDIDTIPVDAFYSGKVGSLIKCSHKCIKQNSLPLYFNNEYSLIRDTC